MDEIPNTCAIPPISDGDVCPHCGAKTSGSETFCCSGCAVAYALLQRTGLGSFYDLARGAELPEGSRRPRGDRDPLTWLPPLLEAAPPREGVRRLKMSVQGIQCAACVWVLEQLFRRGEGALQIEVNPGLGTLEMAYEEGRFDLEAYCLDVGQLGYRLGPPRQTPDAPGGDLLLRFGVVVAIAMNSMIFSFSTYFGLTSEGDPRIFEAFSWANWVLSSIAVWIGGQVFIKGSWVALKRGVLHLDVPIALGIILAFVGSTWSFFETGGSAAYFDTLTLFIAFMLLGRLLLRRVTTSNRQMLLEDGGIEGLLVRRIEPDGSVHVIPGGEIDVGMELSLAPEEVAPVRARLVGEGGDLALDWMNGEPEPKAFAVGETLPAGARNVSGRSLRVVAEEPFSASGLRALLSPMSEAGGTEAEEGLLLSRFWDRLSRIYVALVLALGALGFTLWLGQGLERSLEVTIAILVVTCPCALGLATPLAYELALGALRKRGLFVTRISLLDRALATRKVIFDKTGTLTLGELHLSDDDALDALDEASLAALGSLCAQSNHPRSRALFGALLARGHRPRARDRVEERPGEGVSLGGYRLGSAAFVGGGLPEGERGGESLTYFAHEGEILGAFSFEESLHGDAREEVQRLKAMGMEVYLFSGDGVQRAQAAGEALGIEAENTRGGLSPEDKAELIRLMDDGDTLMIGDGINDALAFSAAAAAGTPAIDRPTLPARADFFMMVQGAPPVAELLAVSKHTRAVVYRNLALAAAYNFIATGLALLGVMSPLICAISMPLSSIIILLMTARSMSARSLLHTQGKDWSPRRAPEIYPRNLAEVSPH